MGYPVMVKVRKLTLKLIFFFALSAQILIEIVKLIYPITQIPMYLKENIYYVKYLILRKYKNIL